MNRPLRISFNKNPNNLDPQKCSDVVSSALIFLLFKGLMRLEANGELVYDLADSVQISNEDKRYIFQLGRHYWSNGKPITAQDFVYSWKRALHPDFPLISHDFFYPIRNAEKAKQGKAKEDAIGIYAKGSHELIIELERPCPHFLELTSFCPLFPIPRFSLPESIGQIASGAFLLEKYEQNKEISLRRNSFSRNHSNGKTASIQIKIIPDEKEALYLYENEELDWMGEPLSPIPANYLRAFSLKKEFKPIGGIVSCFFNALDPFFYNKKLRASFAYALNLEKILQSILFHNVFPTNSLITPKMKPSFTSHFNPLLAKRLFKEVLKEFKISSLNLPLSFETTDINWRLAKAIKFNLKTVLGMNVQLEPLTFKELEQKLSKRQFSMVIRKWFAQYTDPINVLELFESRDSLKNISGWQSVKYQKLLKHYRKTSDLNLKQNFLEKAEDVLKEEAPAFPLCYCQYSYLQKPHLKNLAISPIGLLHFDQAIIDETKKSQAMHQAYI